MFLSGKISVKLTLSQNAHFCRLLHMLKFIRCSGKPNGPKICGWGTKFNFKNWGWSPHSEKVEQASSCRLDILCWESGVPWPFHGNLISCLVKCRLLFLGDGEDLAKTMIITAMAKTMPVTIMTMMMLTMECRQWNLVQRWRWFGSCYCSARSGLGPRQLHEAVAGEPCGGGERWECDDDRDSGDRCNHVTWCDVRSPRQW